VPCTPAQGRAAVWRKHGFEPPFWGDLWGFLALRIGACFHALNTGRYSRLHSRCDVSPSRHTHRRENTPAGNSWILGFWRSWGCKMTRLFSHETAWPLAPRPLKPRKISAAPTSFTTARRPRTRTAERLLAGLRRGRRCTPAPCAGHARPTDRPRATGGRQASG
jgi:hypothetical protein